MSKINKYHINTDRKKNAYDLIRVFVNMNRTNFHQPHGIRKKEILFSALNFECIHSSGFAFKISSSVQIQASVSPWFVTLKTLSFYFGLSVWFAQKWKLFFVYVFTILTGMNYIRNHNAKLFHLEYGHFWQKTTHTRTMNYVTFNIANNLSKIAFKYKENHSNILYYF